MRTLPGITDPTLLRAYRAARHLLRRKNVTGLSIGTAWRGGMPAETALCIMVRDKIDDAQLQARWRFPRSIEGVPVDVLAFRMTPHALPQAERVLRRATIAATLVPGVAVCDGSRFGSIGMIVRRAGDPAPYLLTSWHVLPAGQGSAVYQTQTASAASRIGIVAGSMLDRTGDAALVKLNRNGSNQPCGVTQRLSGARDAVQGEVLRKSGCMTGITEGLVDHVGEFQVPYEQGTVTMAGFLLRRLPGAAGDISMEGDSGAVWFDPATGEAVGMTVSGDEDGGPETEEWTFACNVRAVLERLKVEVA